MKDLNFVDPDVVSKQEILANFVKDSKPKILLNLGKYSSEYTEWLDSITNEINLTSEEADVVYELLETAGDSKPALLFNSSFFSIERDDSELLKRFFRTDLFNGERIKSIPLFFEKFGAKEIFHPFVGKIIKEIKEHCVQNKEFAEAYQAKLAEIRKNNGSLQERLALYIRHYIPLKSLNDKNTNENITDLFFELEQPIFNKYKQSLSLEDFVQENIPLGIFPQILNFPFFQEQNEDVYQNMIQQYPGLSRKDALLDRLLPCFAAIAIKNMDGMLDMLNKLNMSLLLRYNFNDTDLTLYAPELSLFLCVLDQLCEKNEKEHNISISFIYVIIVAFKNRLLIMLDIIKKYPQTQQMIVELCYRIFESWDTPVCPPIFSHRAKAVIPACIIGMYKDPWHGLKLLLIALRKTRMEWVDASLNGDLNGCYYDHQNDANIKLFGEINLYFGFFRESLKSLRQDMANGLSDWLKPLPESKKGNLEKRLAEFPEIEKDREGFDITYTEPDPVWRYAYVRAIADLGVDVDGKGHYIHSVMDMVAKEDPSEMVRKAAEKASAKLKNLRNGWGGDEHYQKLPLAFWWLKQASRVALNLPIDREKSLITRSDDNGFWKQLNRKNNEEEIERQWEEDFLREKDSMREGQKEWFEKEIYKKKQVREEQRRIEKLLRARLKI